MPDLTPEELDRLLATQERVGSFYLPTETLRTLVRMARRGMVLERALRWFNRDNTEDVKCTPA